MEIDIPSVLLGFGIGIGVTLASVWGLTYYLAHYLTAAEMIQLIS